MVLIVEDDPVNSYVLERTVRAAGFQAHPTLTAQSAHDLLRENRLQIPQLIVVDAHQEGTLGAQFLLNLKREEAFKNVPVVVVTGAPEMATALGAVADAVLLKPFDMFKLAEKLKALASAY